MIWLREKRKGLRLGKVRIAKGNAYGTRPLAHQANKENQNPYPLLLRFDLWVCISGTPNSLDRPSLYLQTRNLDVHECDTFSDNDPIRKTFNFVLCHDIPRPVKRTAWPVIFAGKSSKLLCTSIRLGLYVVLSTEVRRERGAIYTNR